MFQLSRATLRRTASSLGGLTLHGRTALRAAGLLAVAGLLLTMTMASAPAEAHSIHGYTLDFFRLEAVEESGEIGSDEPYVLLAVINLTTGEVVVKRTSVFSAVDSGESRLQTVRLWGPSGSAAPFPSALPTGGGNPDNLIILVLPIEHDDCNVETIRSRVESSLRSRLSELRGSSRDVIVDRLQVSMSIAAQCTVSSPVHTPDDRIGFPQELRITAADVSAAHGGTTVEKPLNHDEINGPEFYRTHFRLQAASSVLAP